MPTEEGMPLVSGEYKTGILLNTLECTDSFPPSLSFLTSLEPPDWDHKSYLLFSSAQLLAD